MGKSKEEYTLHQQQYSEDFPDELAQEQHLQQIEQGVTILTKRHSADFLTPISEEVLDVMYQCGYSACHQENMLICLHRGTTEVRFDVFNTRVNIDNKSFAQLPSSIDDGSLLMCMHMLGLINIFPIYKQYTKQ